MVGQSTNDPKSDDLEATIARINAQQDKSSLTEYQKALVKWHRNVDKRYAWVILFSYWLIMVATLGPLRVYGLIYAKVTNDGIYTREQASWPSSMLFIVENGVGPIVSIIAYHISFQQCLLIGGLLVTLGNGLTALSGSLFMDTFLIGVVQGIGCAFLFIPYMSIINEYFLKYRAIAVGASLCGGTMSIFVLSPIFQWLFKNYPWRYSYYALGLVGSLVLLTVPLLKPNPKPKLPSAPPPKCIETAEKKVSAEDKRFDTLTRLSMRALSHQSSLRRQSSAFIASRAPVQRQDSLVSDCSIDSSLPRNASGVGGDRTPQIERKQLEAKASSGAVVSQHPIAFKQELASQAELSRAGSVSDFFAGQTTATATATATEEETIGLSTIWSILKTPVFYMICCQEFLYLWVFAAYTLVLVDYGIDRGLSPEQATFLLNFQSIGEIVGRLGLTILVDLQGYLSNKSVAILTYFLLATSLSLVTVVSGYAWMAAITVSVMALSSLLFILINGLLVDNFGERKVTICYGMTCCSSGMMQIFRPMVVGYFRDTHGSYDLLMLSVGVACVFGGTLWILEPLISRCCGPKRPDRVQHSNATGKTIDS